MPMRRRSLHCRRRLVESRILLAGLPTFGRRCFALDLIGRVAPSQGLTQCQLEVLLNGGIIGPVGFLFQQSALYDSLTIEENVAFPLARHTNLSTEEQRQRVRDLLSSVGMEEDMGKMPSEISGGMQKRVGLARALVLSSLAESSFQLPGLSPWPFRRTAFSKYHLCIRHL